MNFDENAILLPEENNDESDSEEFEQKITILESKDEIVEKKKENLPSLHGVRLPKEEKITRKDIEQHLERRLIIHLKYCKEKCSKLPEIDYQNFLECHCYRDTGTKHQLHLMNCLKHMYCLECLVQKAEANLIPYFTETDDHDYIEWDHAYEDLYWFRPPPLKSDKNSKRKYKFGIIVIKSKKKSGLYKYSARHHLPVDRIVLKKKIINGKKKIKFNKNNSFILYFR